MSDAFSLETLARQIIVRYRGTGHTRFALPAALCDEFFAAVIENNLRNLPGVYRATLYRSQGKLSVYYDPHACGLHDVARCLYGALATPAAQKQRAAAIASMTQRLHVAQPLQWLKDKTGSLKAKTVDWKTKAKLLTQFASGQSKGKSMLQGMLSEKSVINFTNDVVVFYLVKTHWELINQKWLKQPLKYRNAWLTTFYLVFLLVRYRKQSAKKP
ncbi:MAG: hypothetical protein KGJ19_07120 [Betaproteobacteria bacterium]|nr:hypothetical protein [Betaproteobacteria bacterium]MDE2309744.1 hypothetical protein [Betaproteobacteria bacterium]